jgi:heme/copper-type cytochrome/quinol oxidase subunit 2
MPSESAIAQVWIWSLVIYFVVVAVVAVLLTLILMTTRQIKTGAAAIWASGQQVANNTIQIPLLARTNHLVASILDSAVRTAGAVAAVEQHAGSCPHCPTCVTGGPRGGRS